MKSFGILVARYVLSCNKAVVLWVLLVEAVPEVY